MLLNKLYLNDEKDVWSHNDSFIACLNYKDVQGCGS